MKEKIKAISEKNHLKRNLFFLFLILFIASWSYLLAVFGADSIVNFLGVKNGYLIIILISLFGGISTFGSPIYLTTVTTFILGGLNPILISFISGVSLFIGDSIFYFLGYYGRKALAPFFEKHFTKFSNFIEKKPYWMSMIFIYIYYSIAPLPNDILSVPLGVAHYKYSKFAPPVILGNITFLLILTTLIYSAI